METAQAYSVLCAKKFKLPMKRDVKDCALNHFLIEFLMPCEERTLIKAQTTKQVLKLVSYTFWKYYHEMELYFYVCYIVGFLLIFMYHLKLEDDVVPI